MDFSTAKKLPINIDEPKRFFLFQNKKLLLANTESNISIPLVHDIADLPVQLQSFQYLGSHAGTPCFSGEIDTVSDIPENIILLGLRDLYGILDDDLFAVAGRALHINDWDGTFRICSRCGTDLKDEENELAKYCPQCNQHFFPNPAPAVIVAVIKDDMILLARSERFIKKYFYSVLAGFVEPGENLEECVAREVKEETNIEVKNIKYFGSQPWPLTNSLMIAFTAEYAKGEIKIDQDEIADAKWFKAGDIPEIPGKISIARKLIDWFVEKNSNS